MKEKKTLQRKKKKKSEKKKNNPNKYAYRDPNYISSLFLFIYS